MRTARLSMPAVALLLVFAIPAGASAGAVPAGKVVSGCLPGVVPNGFLAAVAASSSSNSWAVGFDSRSAGRSQTLAEQWNGSTWSVQPTASPASQKLLYAVSCPLAGTCTATGGITAGTGVPYTHDQPLAEQK